MFGAPWADRVAVVVFGCVALLSLAHLAAAWRDSSTAGRAGAVLTAPAVHAGCAIVMAAGMGAMALMLG